jgi:hypothetical protein
MVKACGQEASYWIDLASAFSESVAGPAGDGRLAQGGFFRIHSESIG